MRIQQAAAATGVRPRLLRYYEDKGLLHPARTPAGYRDYTDIDLAVIIQVRQLLDAGLSTATIKDLLPCLTDHTSRTTSACPAFLAQLRREHTRMTTAIHTLTASRNLIDTILTASTTPAAHQPNRSPHNRPH